MTGLCVSVYLLYSNTDSCHSPGCLGNSLSIWAPLINKNKLTWTISHNHKTLLTFHYDATNCHVQGFNFLEFLVNGISTRSLGLVNLQSIPVCKTQKLHLVSRKFYQFNFSNPLNLIWLLIAAESKYNTISKMYNIKVI